MQDFFHQQYQISPEYFHMLSQANPQHTTTPSTPRTQISDVCDHLSLWYWFIFTKIPEGCIIYKIKPPGFHQESSTTLQKKTHTHLHNRTFEMDYLSFTVYLRLIPPEFGPLHISNFYQEAGGLAAKLSCAQWASAQTAPVEFGV